MKRMIIEGKIERETPEFYYVKIDGQLHTFNKKWYLVVDWNRNDDTIDAQAK